MTEHFNNNDSLNALDAQYNAQKIAFAPIIFQVARLMRDFGILELLHNNRKTGLSLEELSQKLDLTKYSIQVLLETSLSSDIVKIKDDKYFVTKTGYFLFSDEMTKVNMNYNHYVNYLGLYELEEALKNNKAEGLKVFGDWDTIYPALSTLPPKVSQSWFEFDHFYSDDAFPKAIEILLRNEPKSILDIGGNTGKFSLNIVKNSTNTNVTIMDLPQQIALAKENIGKTEFKDRVNYIPQNVLDHSKDIPSGYDIIWMSQFLDCFDEDNIVQLLTRAKKSLNEGARVYIMEPLWDKQAYETSAYCIINTSPYFSAMANGYSKMFNFKDMESYINQAGLTIEKEIHNIGICQSILVCK